MASLPSTVTSPISPSKTPTNSHNSYGGCLDEDLDEIDLESLRYVFGSASPEELNRRKPHELRQLWLEKTTVDTTAAMVTPRAATAREKARDKMPRFLLDPKNKDHVAPHTYALKLLLQNDKRRSPTGDGLYRRVSTAGDREEDFDAQRDEEEDPSPSKQRRNFLFDRTSANPREMAVMVPLVLVAVVSLTCQFVLEVLGGAGAIWGCAEIFRLRSGGNTDPSWNFYTLAALVVGFCCLVRFFLVHPFFPAANDPTFVETHRTLYRLLRKPSRQHHARVSKRLGTMVELTRAVARDPVLFLHPTKGPAVASLASSCGCYCVCCGSRWPSSSIGTPRGGDGDDDEPPTVSPLSLRKPSPQRSTWELPDHDEAEVQGPGDASPQSVMKPLEIH